eukprot:CAMPEP_0198267128 /NCGR_PEP_ID=MMETSP1447-20131203/31681_1 /TAXON_ID=420782 /ORGANISM="Chaetoceros dichaeta, Strain CCMP1751" /LENGTH=521 /DNA_ID=CAMNT_0043957553 /DNA_START=181 /DNA_END=1746 /DNA_ORIENTATION=-
MSYTAKTPKDYRWIRYAVVSCAVFQIIVMYDTIRALARINGQTISQPALREFKSNNDDASEDGKSEDGDSKNDNDFSDDGDGSKDITKVAEPREVFWLNERYFDMWKCDYYSGSWMLPIERFDPVLAVDMQTLEDGSHNVFGVNTKHARMSVDWLDFSVEHLSRWIREFDMFAAHHNDVAVNKITENLLKYIKDTPERTKALLSASESNTPLLHPTIAIISAGSMYDHGSDVTKAAMMGATVASMLRTGFGRIVLIVVDEEDIRAVQETLELLSQQYAGKNDWIKGTALSYVVVEEELYKTELVDVHKPRAAIYGLQQALRGKFNATYTTQWLGTTHEPSYWKYIYFSENDLILQTRTASLPSIYNELERGRVLFPHRLEPVPHELDMTTKDGKNVLPAKGAFLNIVNLDGDEDMCCDGGNDRPSWDKEDDPSDTKCYGWWWSCGHTQEWQESGMADEVKHRRILKYAPFIRLNQGSNIVSISGSEHERNCHPKKRQTPNDICEKPSKSGRSFATSEEHTE